MATLQNPAKRSSPLLQRCTPTKHVLSCQHVLGSHNPVPCSETCLNPCSAPGVFAFHCAQCRCESDEHLLSCLAALGTLLYAYDPRLPTPIDPLHAEGLTLHDRTIPTLVLEQLVEPLAAHKFWFQYRLEEKVSVAYILLTRNSLRGRLVKCSTGFAITADAEVMRIMRDSRARRKAKGSIRRVVHGVQSSLDASAWWAKSQASASQHKVPQVGRHLEREWELSRREREELWDEVLRLTNSSPTSFVQ